MEPEYGFLDPPPPEDHLHEAIQRLLLNQIHNMKEDIKLNTDKLHTLPDLKHYDTRDTTTPFGVSIGQGEFFHILHRDRLILIYLS